MGEESVGRGAIYSLLPTDLPTGFLPSVSPSAKPSVIMTGNRHVTARTCYSNPSVIPSVVLTVHPSRHRYGSGISRVRAPVFNSVGDSVGKITRQTLRATARPFFIDSEFSVGNSVGNYRRTMSVGNYRPNYRRIFAVGDFGREIPTEKIPSVCPLVFSDFLVVDVSFLTSLPGGSERLEIFYADLSDPSGFEVAIKGCVGVFHVASPTLDFGNGEPEEVVIQRATDGTLGILKACLNSKTVKRVVLTSSASAVAFNGSGVETMDEAYWSDVDYIRASNLPIGPYFVSKTLTEKRALEFAQEHGLDLVTLTPAYIHGPFICPNMPFSVHISLAMVLGDRERYGLLINAPMVHIDDVARAHIFLLEYPEAKGRYICSKDTITIEEMSEFLSAKYPEYSIPTLEYLKDVEGLKIPGLSSKKLLDSGFKFRYGLEDMFDGAIQCCKEKGLLYFHESRTN